MLSKSQLGPDHKGMLSRRMRGAFGAVSELGLIEQIRQQFARKRSRAIELGIGDDCAILRPRLGWEVLVTTDLLLEGRHFRRDLHSPESAGHRCLARGLSDIAAMGADPIAAFLSFGLPRQTMKSAVERRWIARFLDGIRWLADGSGVVLAGGDTGEVLGDTLVADIVLVGHAPRGAALRRSGASAGDAIYVTGALGGAAAELEAMLAGKGRRLKRETASRALGGPQSRLRSYPQSHPQSYPEPRLQVGAALRRRPGVTACLDISDGLSTDLGHLCEASGVSAEIWEAELPVHELAAGLSRRFGDDRALTAALHGGEDYELLFTAKPETRLPKRIAGTAVTRIGEILPRSKGRSRMTLVSAEGIRAVLKPGGWEHFREHRR